VKKIVLTGRGAGQWKQYASVCWTAHAADTTAPIKVRGLLNLAILRRVEEDCI